MLFSDKSKFLHQKRTHVAKEILIFPVGITNIAAKEPCTMLLGFPGVVEMLKMWNAEVRLRCF